jgi:NAD(P)-dependent dehydrogenase (short-subunit alcohol dehydrogenase family)
MTLYFNGIRDDFERSLLFLDVLHQRGNDYLMNLDPVGVRVHAISMLNQAAHKAPLVELVDIMDVGWTCAYLATPFAHRVTGGTVYIDGGANIIA